MVVFDFRMRDCIKQNYLRIISKKYSRIRFRFLFSRVSLSILVFIVFLLSLFPIISSDIISIDDVTFDSGDDSSFTHSHSISGLNRLLVVAVTLDNGSSDKRVSSITYAGTNLTRFPEIANDGGSPRADAWYMVNPPTGSNNVVVSSYGVH